VEERISEGPRRQLHILSVKKSSLNDDAGGTPRSYASFFYNSKAMPETVSSPQS
jgi:hypothetical protein